MSGMFAAQVAKLRGSAVPLIVLAAPGLTGVLSLLAVTTPEAVPGWGSLLGGFVVPIWALFVLPSTAALLAALTAQLDHANDQLDHVLALPLRRWRVHGAALAVILLAVILVAVLSAVAAGLGGALGAVLRGAEMGPLPVLGLVRAFASVTGAGFLLALLQAWFALRSKSFLGPVGLGAVGTLGALAVAMTGSAHGLLLPWALPFLSATTGGSTPLLVGGLVGLAAAPLAVIDLSRAVRSARIYAGRGRIGSVLRTSRNERRLATPGPARTARLPFGRVPTARRASRPPPAPANALRSQP